MRFACVAEVIAAVITAVAFYNEERPHMSIDMMTPREAASCTGELKKHWTSHRQEHIKAKQAEAQAMESAIPMPQPAAVPIAGSI